MYTICFCKGEKNLENVIFSRLNKYWLFPLKILYALLYYFIELILYGAFQSGVRYIPTKVTKTPAKLPYLHKKSDSVTARKTLLPTLLKKKKKSKYTSPKYRSVGTYLAAE